MVVAMSASSTGVDTTTPTPTTRCVPVMVFAHEAAGVLAPRSVIEKPRPREWIGDERGGEPVRVAHGRAEHDGAASGAAADEQRAEPADESIHHDGRAVLVGDVEAAGGPVVADVPHRRAEHVEVEVLGAVSGTQCGLEESPRFGLVTLHEQRRQSTHIVLLRRPTGGGVAARWRRGCDLVEVGEAHVPMSSDARAGKPAGADVSIRGHVVHAE